MKAPRYDDVMHVLVASATRALKRGRLGSLQVKLTWEQILADLRAKHERFGIADRYPLSRRSLARWLEALEQLRYFYRDTETVRYPDGRIKYRLTTFVFGTNGILWIKNYWPDPHALLARAIVPKVASRFKSDVIQKERSVDKSPTDRPSWKGRTRSSLGPIEAAAAARRAVEALSREGAGRRSGADPIPPAGSATDAPAPRSGGGRGSADPRRDRRP